MTRARFPQRELGRNEKNLELGKRSGHQMLHRSLRHGTHWASLVCVPEVAAICRAAAWPSPLDGHSTRTDGTSDSLTSSTCALATVTQWGHVFTGKLVTDLTPRCLLTQTGDDGSSRGCGSDPAAREVGRIRAEPQVRVVSGTGAP